MSTVTKLPHNDMHKSPLGKRRRVGLDTSSSAHKSSTIEVVSAYTIEVDPEVDEYIIEEQSLAEERLDEIGISWEAPTIEVDDVIYI